MPIWNNENFKYAPLLRLRPGEMRALGQLPNADKQLIAPLIPIGTWATSRSLDRALEKIEETLGDPNHRFIADLIPNARTIEGNYDIHASLRSLAGPNNGYQEWRRFIADHERMIPVIRSGTEAAIRRQVENFEPLNRGLVVRVTNLQEVATLVLPVLAAIRDPNNLLIVADLSQIRDVITPLISATAFLTALTATDHPTLHVAVAGTSFPFSFQGSADETIRLPILERDVFS